MGVIKGCWTFKVVFEIEVESFSDFTDEMLYHECAEQLYAASPFSGEMRKKQKDNFRVTLDHIENESDYSGPEYLDYLYEHRGEAGNLREFLPKLNDDQKN